MAAKVTKAGLLGEAELNEFGDVAFPYTVNALNSKAAVTVSICNGSAAKRTVRVGYSIGGAAPTAARWLLGGALGIDIAPGATQQVTTMLGTGQGIAVKGPAITGGPSISVTVNGQEETI